jgi:cytochrome b561
MQWKNSQKSYGMTAIILHWSSALLVIFILGLGIYMTDLPDGDFKWSWYGLHKSIGLLIFMLLILRVIWKRLNTTPPLPNNLKRASFIAS